MSVVLTSDYSERIQNGLAGLVPSHYTMQCFSTFIHRDQNLFLFRRVHLDVSSMTKAVPTYFEGLRSKVANLVFGSCRFILGVGCVFGGQGRQLLLSPLELFVDHVDVGRCSVVANKL